MRDVDGRSEDCGRGKFAECYGVGEAAVLDGSVSLARGVSRWRLAHWTGGYMSVLGDYSDADMITLASFSASGMSLSVSLVKSLSALRTSPDIFKVVVGWRVGSGGYSEGEVVWKQDGCGGRWLGVMKMHATWNMLSVRAAHSGMRYSRLC